ncbi:lysyl endopeptidase [Actinokineospora sp. UTMC 2448]|uniref:lysyl endopeptidase n=1 Tax=Actinokineospora sp. UTMC 2448 TaxID=2268449 RepID=UPI002164ECD8|nr:lysyl endopeptidase [Actinokineospora sp. UTMC 2448]UVS78498.1 hypothetical protein Actkin_02231 [Actinokineospora sp. UTMC 2448]
MDHIAEQSSTASNGQSAVFVGGPTYPDNKDAAQVIADLRKSGFTTVILWSIHVAVKGADTKDGDLFYNSVKIISDGEYCGAKAWPPLLKSLRTDKPSSVNRVEVSVGSAPPAKDWENIAALIKQHGTGPTSVLYRNFKKLKEITGADAINNDDEKCYDVSSTVAFARMASQLGYKFTFAPYQKMKEYWAKVMADLGAIVDRAYVQCYEGGWRNADAKCLCEWSTELKNVAVFPGLWCRHATSAGKPCDQGDSPDEMKKKMSSWKKDCDKIAGGFLWLYDDIRKCAGSTGFTSANYAQAINEATKSKKAATTAV